MNALALSISESTEFMLGGPILAKNPEKWLFGLFRAKLASETQKLAPPLKKGCFWGSRP